MTTCRLLHPLEGVISHSARTWSPSPHRRPLTRHRIVHAHYLLRVCRRSVGVGLSRVSCSGRVCWRRHTPRPTVEHKNTVRSLHTSGRFVPGYQWRGDRRGLARPHRVRRTHTHTPSSHLELCHACTASCNTSCTAPDLWCVPVLRHGVSTSMQVTSTRRSCGSGSRSISGPSCRWVVPQTMTPCSARSVCCGEHVMMADVLCGYERLGCVEAMLTRSLM